MAFAGAVAVVVSCVRTVCTVPWVATPLRSVSPCVALPRSPGEHWSARCAWWSVPQGASLLSRPWTTASGHRRPCCAPLCSCSCVFQFCRGCAYVCQRLRAAWHARLALLWSVRPGGAYGPPFPGLIVPQYCAPMDNFLEGHVRGCPDVAFLSVLGGGWRAGGRVVGRVPCVPLMGSVSGLE